ncbi:Glucan 4-alpha-glucosidase [Madurella fahalii]|uniref:Glucan 4-alpha-glucosidase n=1 Tax=Madurella fahalii TaxID=1157608 RepID=A0ABQ0GDH1_9PEZI
MDPTGNKAGELERRVSTRSSVRISVNDVDEEPDFVAAGVVADGFRPSNIQHRPAPSTPSLASASTLLADESPGSSSRSGRPSSASKLHMSQDSLSSRNEPAGLTRHNTNSTESTAYFPNDTPYQGPLGPSHPYQMYPQNVRPTRTTSMTTSSTLPLSESSYSGPRGPSHPYGLYPQIDGIQSSAIQASSIPLGFHGLPDQYQRRVGPDGEEVGDMIGPDGHTEQLPPYSRYPDETYVQKATVADGFPGIVQGGASIVPLNVTVPSSTLPAIPGAGGLGLATRNPEFESTDDLGSPRSRHSSRSFTSDDSQRRIKLDDEVSEKRNPPKKWQVWMRRKLWGIIPYWVMCLIAVLLVLMGVILGSVIGTFLAKQKKGRKPGPWDPRSDVVPIPTPTDLPPLPIGNYSMPLLDDLRSSKCFEDPTLSPAWNCRSVTPSLYLTVSGTNGRYNISVDSNHDFILLNHVYAYGTQPPLIREPVALDLVTDKSEPNRGPAWFKTLPYTKTVILPERALSRSDSTESAEIGEKKVRHVTIDPGMANFKKKMVAQSGDKAWVCNWPDTYIELFIYAQQNSSYSNWSLLPSPSTSSTQTSSSSSTTPTPSSEPMVAESALSSLPTGSFDNGGPGNEHSSEGKGYGMQHAHARFPPDSSTKSFTTSSTTSTTSTSSTTSSPSSSSSSSSPSTTTTTEPGSPFPSGYASISPRPPYPRVIKVEERRVPTSGAPMPQCTQVKIQEPGQAAKVVHDDDGEPVVVQIVETEPSWGPVGVPDTDEVDGLERRSFSSSSWDRRRRGLQSRDGADMSACGCMWFLT